MKKPLLPSTAKAVIFFALSKDISENIGHKSKHHKSCKEEGKDSDKFLVFVSHYYIPFGFIKFNFNLS